MDDGDVVAPALVQRALTAGELVFSDGATQVFDADGGTTYVENGRPTRGQWYTDADGHFGSFWPPSYRNTYDLRWIVEDGTIVGLHRPRSHTIRRPLPGLITIHRQRRQSRQHQRNEPRLADQ